MKKQSVIPANYDPHTIPESVTAREEVYVSQGFINRRTIFLRLSETRSTPTRRVYVIRLIGSKKRIGPKYVVNVHRSITPGQPRDLAPYSH